MDVCFTVETCLAKEPNRETFVRRWLHGQSISELDELAKRLLAVIAGLR